MPRRTAAFDDRWENKGPNTERGPLWTVLSEAERRELEEARPRVRADCEPGGKNEMRPCPFVGCRHHLGGHVTTGGSLQVVRELEVMRETCALDVADKGGVTLEECGEIFQLTRERIRQIESKALAKLKKRGWSLRDMLMPPPRWDDPL